MTALQNDNNYLKKKHWQTTSTQRHIEKQVLKSKIWNLNYNARSFNIRQDMIFNF